MKIGTQFDRILSAHQIENAAQDTLKYWFATYLRELERQNDIAEGTLEIPVNYSTRNTLSGQAAEQTPKIVIISPGLHDAPIQTGQGQYRAMWRLGVGIAVSGKLDDDNEEVLGINTLVKIYGATVRGIMAQNGGYDATQNHTVGLQGLLGNAGTTWVDESYPDTPIRGQILQYQVASILFHVDVERVLTRFAGPDSPDDINVDWGQVETVDVSLVKESIS